MGTYHTFTGLEPGIELNQQPGIRQEMNGEEQTEILRLINSIYFFIECVFIMKEKNKYRLVVLHHCMVLCDKKYPTLRGCKIAFSRMFKKKSGRKM